jgi:hypothetical protein
MKLVVPIKTNIQLPRLTSNKILTISISFIHNIWTGIYMTSCSTFLSPNSMRVQMTDVKPFGTMFQLTACSLFKQYNKNKETMNMNAL